MAKTFTCEHCGETFPELRTEADRAMEYQEAFTPEQRTDDEMPVVLCTDCYQAAMDYLRDQGFI